MKTIYHSQATHKSRFFSLLVAILIICASASAQSFKTQVKYVDPTETSLNAGLQLSNIQPADFDALASKIEAGNLYTVTKEFFAQKNTGNIVIKSRMKADVKDLESLLKQVGIHTVEYNGNTIPSQQIQANYSPVNKTEVKQIDRIR
jgi:hypothetical protein